MAQQNNQVTHAVLSKCKNTNTEHQAPVKTCLHRVAFQSRMVLSAEPVSTAPLFAVATAQTAALCPCTFVHSVKA